MHNLCVVRVVLDYIIDVAADGSQKMRGILETNRILSEGRHEALQVIRIRDFGRSFSAGLGCETLGYPLGRASLRFHHEMRLVDFDFYD